jgi:hypothetical protein
MTTHSSLFFIESHSIDLSQDVAACSCLIFAGIRSRLLRRIHCRAPQLTGIYRRWDPLPDDHVLHRILRCACISPDIYKRGLVVCCSALRHAACFFA